MIRFEIDNKIKLMEYDKHMQIGISDVNLSNKIYSFFEDYFTVKRGKSDAYESVDIIVDGKPISKSRFSFIGINSFKEIDGLLNIKKDSIIGRYNEKYLDTVEIKNELLGLEKQYYAIINLIERRYELNDVFKLKYKNLSKDIFSMKNIEFELDFDGDSFDKLKLIIYILDELGACLSEQYLIYLNNVESYLTISQLTEMKLLIEKSKSLFMIVATQNSNYLDYNYVDKINFLIDDRIVHIADIDYLCQKASKYIDEFDHIISSYEMSDFLSRHAFEVINKCFEGKDDDKKLYEAIISIEKNKNMSDNIAMESTLII